MIDILSDWWKIIIFYDYDLTMMILSFSFGIIVGMYIWHVRIFWERR